MRLAVTAFAILSAGGALVALDRSLVPERGPVGSTAVSAPPEVLWTTEPRRVADNHGLRRLPDRVRPPGDVPPLPAPPAFRVVTPAPEAIPLRDLDGGPRWAVARDPGRVEEVARDRRARRQARWDASPFPRRRQAWRDRQRSASAAFERSPNYDLLRR